MAKLIRCPNCSKGASRYLMTRQNKREYDEELHMPIIVYMCGICRTKVKITGVICLDCDGRGEYTKVVDTVHAYEAGLELCSHCKGLGIIPKRYKIIFGNKPRKKRHHLREEFDMDNFDLREFIAADNRYRGFPHGCDRSRGDPFGTDW